MDPDRIAIRRVLAPHKRRNNLIAAAIFALDLGGYLVLSLAVCFAGSICLKLAAAVGTGVFVGRLFTIGHDACHGSFTTNPRWNQVLGRIAFLPSYTPFATWELGHNILHHGYTNLKGFDYVWVPFSKEEFDALPRWRQYLERIYRSAGGHGLHYCLEIWWRKLFFPATSEVGHGNPAYFYDSCLVLGYGACQVAGLLAFAHGSQQSASTLILIGLGIPFLVWNVMMGFAIFQHHTHPLVVWVKDRSQWSSLEAQLSGTVHVVLPRPIGLLLNNVMEHTAHHLDVGIPMYELNRAQNATERAFLEHMIVQRWTWSGFLHSVRCCKLYDFEQRQWLTFNGEPSNSENRPWL